jgi:DNA-binding LacI/PurR family transcriptional regulator
VVGFDDIAEAARPTYDLTTMRQDSVQMARQAVALLLSRLEDPVADARSLIVEATFIPRTSARLSAILN